MTDRGAEAPLVIHDDDRMGSGCDAEELRRDAVLFRALGMYRAPCECMRRRGRTARHAIAAARPRAETRACRVLTVWMSMNR